MVIDFHAKNQVNICKRLEKNSGKLFNRWNLLSPRPVISSKINDLHAKNQVEIGNCLGKKSGKLFHRWNLLSPKPVISPKIDGG